MAPQETASYYGAVVMDRGEKSVPAASPLAKRIAVAVLAAMAVVGVATMMASSSVPVRETFVVDIGAEAAARLPDCKCDPAIPCQYLYSEEDYVEKQATAPTWLSLGDPRIQVFIEKGVMVCPLVSGDDGECRDVTHARSDKIRLGKPQKYTNDQTDPLFRNVAVCENFDTNCNTAAVTCGKHGFCVADSKTDGTGVGLTRHVKNNEKHTCVCDPGYSFSAGQCVNIDECQDETLHNCNTFASCLDKEPKGDRLQELSEPKFTCTCNTGYSGTGYDSTSTIALIAPFQGKVGEPGCEDIDMCISDEMTCKHYESCKDGDAKEEDYGYRCVCAEGWDKSDSQKCATDIDECGLNKCALNTNCVNNDGSFTCTCKTNWVSGNDHKDGKLTCLKQDFCAPENPCMNGGSCTQGDPGCGFDETKGWPKLKKMIEDNSLPEPTDTTGRSEKLSLYTDYWAVKTDMSKYNVEKDCYTCACVGGWTGGDCEVDVNECIATDESHGCDPNADCVNTAGSFECICHLGWYMDGTKCKDIDDCEESTPCAHGGTCVDCGTLCFTCTCVIGWRGTTCTKDWNECTMGIHDCNDDATCINTPGSYDCNCDPGFAGTGFGGTSVSRVDYVENVDASEDQRTTDAVLYLKTLAKSPGCIDINDCGYNQFESPCKNLAECKDMGTGSYRCICKAGWTDSECDEDVNECNPAEWPENSCSPYATCMNKKRTENSEGYSCECNTGYTGTGQVCTDINDCMNKDKLRCAENGFCKDLGVDYFKCQCNAGYIGTECDADENECVVGSDKCGRNSNCLNTEGSYECVCEEGYSGDDPTISGGGCIDTNDCTAAAKPCNEHGTCEDIGVGHFQCTCDKGWTDATCDFDVNECLSLEDPCPESAICRNTPGSYKCECRAGFTGTAEPGTKCVDFDDCKDYKVGDRVVTNGGCKFGTCDSGVTSGATGNMRVCHCNAGYQGCGSPFCAKDCFDCPKFKAENAECTEVKGGTCTQTCKTGFWGKKGECAITCIKCKTCEKGFMEKTQCKQSDNGDTVCENVNECVDETVRVSGAGTASMENWGPHNCQKAHAGCLDTEGSYECACEPGYWGHGFGTNGCAKCTVCQAGFHESSPCTTTSDRTCAIDLPSGNYIIESEADGNRQCLGIFEDEWYPKRFDKGTSAGFCGYASKELLKTNPALQWTFTALYNNEVDFDSQLYTISHKSMDKSFSGERCMYFGSMGTDIYPTLQSCVDYLGGAHCPWGQDAGATMCDFKIIGNNEPSEDAKKLALIENGQAVFKVESIKMSEKKYIIQSKSQDGASYECLSFDDEGAATNPSRYSWGNAGAQFCGVGDWEGYGKEMALLSNKQAIFILSSMS